MVELNQHDKYLFGVAYRMLGSVADAQDVVQDAYLRVLQKRPKSVSRAYLVTVVTRLCLDALKSASRQRQDYIGPWLPDPLITKDVSTDLLLRRESVAMGLMYLFERLAPTDRAVYILREVLELEFSEVAMVVEKSEANCRKILSRAKAKLADGISESCIPPEAMSTVMQLMVAVQARDQDAVMAVLTTDATWVSDGGGAVSAATRPILGAERVAKFVLGITRKGSEGVRFEVTEVNGEVALQFYRDGIVFALWAFSVKSEKVHRVWAIQNPAKLSALALQAVN